MYCFKLLPSILLICFSLSSAGVLAADSYNITKTTGMKKLTYTISTQWDGQQPVDNAQIQLSFLKSTDTDGLVIEVDAPFYNEPIVPPSQPIGSTDKLWNYEVVEVFFLSESEKKYLEIELAPRGHYILLQLDTQQNVLQYELPLKNYTTNWKITKEAGRWNGLATIPFKYLPKDINKFNAYAIHKSGQERVYMSLFPTPKGKYEAPNFHRLSYFKEIDLNSLLE